MESTKNKIHKIVNDYADEHPIEAADFLSQTKEKRDQQRNEFASFEQDGMIERALYETPETLFNKLKTSLTDDEWEWYTSKTGARWFAKKFKAFSLAEKI